MSNRAVSTALVLLLGLACTRGPDLSAPFGSLTNPLLADNRREELAYLARLRCTDGSTPHWRRVGDAPPGPYGHPLDRYRVRCIWLNWETLVYFDRRHRGLVPYAAPDGLELVSDRPRAGLAGLRRGPYSVVP